MTGMGNGNEKVSISKAVYGSSVPVIMHCDRLFIIGKLYAWDKKVKHLI